MGGKKELEPTNNQTGKENKVIEDKESIN